MKPRLLHINQNQNDRNFTYFIFTLFFPTKYCVFWLKFQLCLSLSAQLAISQPLRLMACYRAGIKAFPYQWCHKTIEKTLITKNELQILHWIIPINALKVCYPFGGLMRPSGQWNNHTGIYCNSQRYKTYTLKGINAQPNISAVFQPGNASESFCYPLIPIQMASDNLVQIGSDTTLTTEVLLTWINFDSVLISNHMASKVWGDITFPYPNFNCCTVEVLGMDK